MGASRASLGATLQLYNWQTLYSGAVNLAHRGRDGARHLCRRALGDVRALSVGQFVVFISYLAQLYVPVNQITQSWGLIAGALIGARARVRDPGDRGRPQGRRGANCRTQGRAARSHGAGSVPLSPRDAGAARGSTCRVGRREDRRRRPDRRRQVDPARPVAALFRPDRRERRDRRRRCARIHAQFLAPQIGMVLQPPLIFPLSVRDNIAYGRPERRRRGRSSGRRGSRASTTRDGVARRLRDEARRRRRRAVGGREAAHHDRPRAPPRRADPDPRRADLGARCRDRGAGHGRDRRADAQAAPPSSSRIGSPRCGSCDRIARAARRPIAEHGTYTELLRRGGIFAELYNTQFRDPVRAAP